MRCPVCRGRLKLGAIDDLGPAEVAALRARGIPFPFCSAQCRAVDLGRWIDEEYRVSEPIVPGPNTEEP